MKSGGGCMVFKDWNSANCLQMKPSHMSEESGLSKLLFLRLPLMGFSFNWKWCNWVFRLVLHLKMPIQMSYTFATKEMKWFSGQRFLAFEGSFLCWCIVLRAANCCCLARGGGAGSIRALKNQQSSVSCCACAYAGALTGNVPLLNLWPTEKGGMSPSCLPTSWTIHSDFCSVCLVTTNLWLCYRWKLNHWRRNSQN